MVPMIRSVLILFALLPYACDAGTGVSQFVCEDGACSLNCQQKNFSLNTCLSVDDGTSAMLVDCQGGSGGLKEISWNNANCSGTGTKSSMDVGTCIKGNFGSFINTCVGGQCDKAAIEKLLHPLYRVASSSKGTCSHQVGTTMDGPDIKSEPGVPLWDCCERCQNQVSGCVAAILTGTGWCHYKSAIGAVTSDPDTTVLYATGPAPPSPPPPPATAVTQYQCSDEQCSQNCIKKSFPLNRCNLLDNTDSAINTACDVTTETHTYLVFQGNTQCQGTGESQTDSLGNCQYDPNTQTSFVNGCSYGGLDDFMNISAVMLHASQQRQANALGEVMV